MDYKFEFGLKWLITLKYDDFDEKVNYNIHVWYF